MTAGVILMDRHAAERGFTLVEILLAVSISLLVGLAAAMMLAGIGAATKAESDLRRASVNRQVGAARLGSYMRGASMVLEKGTEYVVLWKGDSNGNFAPELSEIRRIAWDEHSSTVLMAETPETLNPVFDVTYDLADPFGDITDALAGTATFPAVIIVEQVSAWNLSLDVADVQAARLARVQLILESDYGPETVFIVAGLRAAAE